MVLQFPVVSWLILRPHDIAQLYYASNISHEVWQMFARIRIHEI